MNYQADNPYAAPRLPPAESLSVSGYVRIALKGLVGFVLGAVLGAVASVVVLIVALLVSGGTLRINHAQALGYWTLAGWTFVGLVGLVVFARREYHRRTKS
jgi:hypothetical protein